MKPHIKIAVIGGTGKSGRYLVNSLLKKGFTVKMLVRPTSQPEVHSRVETITGDALSYNDVYKTFHGCTAVISTLGLGLPPSESTLFSRATQNILRAMNTLSISRYIVTTGLNVDTPSDQKGESTQMATQWMHKNYPVSTANKQEEYEILTTANVNWTLVRLPLITLTDTVVPIVANLHDCPGSNINAGALAAFLISQLRDDTYLKKAPFIANA